MTEQQKKEAEHLFILGYTPREIIQKISTSEHPVTRAAFNGVRFRGRWQEKRNVYLTELGNASYWISKNA